MNEFSINEDAGDFQVPMSQVSCSSYTESELMALDAADLERLRNQTPSPVPTEPVIPYDSWTAPQISMLFKRSGDITIRDFGYRKGDTRFGGDHGEVSNPPPGTPPLGSYVDATMTSLPTLSPTSHEEANPQPHTPQWRLSSLEKLSMATLPTHHGEEANPQPRTPQQSLSRANGLSLAAFPSPPPTYHSEEFNPKPRPPQRVLSRADGISMAALPTHHRQEANPQPHTPQRSLRRANGSSLAAIPLLSPSTQHRKESAMTSLPSHIGKSEYFVGLDMLPKIMVWGAN
ncbi:hypothetical protein K438DRAFT_1966945 [Mycena galopus ATCC 62051]|nr:hypothetical protein K438DRAFT_1966945 [Mycena galopus ATCC 62051]